MLYYGGNGTTNSANFSTIRNRRGIERTHIQPGMHTYNQACNRDFLFAFRETDNLTSHIIGQFRLGVLYKNF